MGERLKQLLDRFWRFDLVLCSPMKRAVETAEIIARQIKYMGDIPFDKNLVEFGGSD